MFYRNPDQSLFSLIGTDGFIIGVTNLTGSGELVISLNGGGGHTTIPVTLSGPGDIFYPVSNIGGIYDLDQLSRVSFHFIARSPDFSLTLAEISAVPEPSSVFMLGMGGIRFLASRSRVVAGH